MTGTCGFVEIQMTWVYKYVGIKHGFSSIRFARSRGICLKQRPEAEIFNSPDRTDKCKCNERVGRKTLRN